MGPASVPLEHLAAQLRELYRQRDDLMRSAGTVPTLPEEVSAVVDRYYRLLVDAAVMLDVDVPADARSSVDPERRTHHGRFTAETVGRLWRYVRGRFSPGLDLVVPKTSLPDTCV